MYVCVCVCVYICMCVRVCMRMYEDVCVCMCMCICMCMCMCIYVITRHTVYTHHKTSMQPYNCLTQIPNRIHIICTVFRLNARMQELGKEGVARLFFKEYCKGHPALLKPAEDNIDHIKSHTLGHSRWARMTAYRKVLTRDKFIDIFPFIKFIQEKAEDKNDTYGVIKRLNRQVIMRRKRSVKAAMGTDDVQDFDDDISDASSVISLAPTTKSKKKPTDSGKKGNNKAADVTVVEFD